MEGPDRRVIDMTNDLAHYMGQEMKITYTGPIQHKPLNGTQHSNANRTQFTGAVILDKYTYKKVCCHTLIII